MGQKEKSHNPEQGGKSRDFGKKSVLRQKTRLEIEVEEKERRILQNKRGYEVSPCDIIGRRPMGPPPNDSG